MRYEAIIGLIVGIAFVTAYIRAKLKDNSL